MPTIDNSKHDFSELFAKYPNLISQMPDTFTSHQFIQHLAQVEQKLYIEALYDCRDKRRSGKRAPFLIVHGILAQQLLEHPDLIGKVRDVNSRDIFGESNSSSEWRKRKSKR